MRWQPALPLSGVRHRDKAGRCTPFAPFNGQHWASVSRLSCSLLRILMLCYRGWDYPVQNFLAAFSYDRWPYGYGIGTCSIGGQYVARFFKAKPVGVGVE